MEEKCRILPKNAFLRHFSGDVGAFGHGVVDFGAGLGVHQQAGFQRFDFVAVSLVVFRLFVVLLELGHIDPIDFYRKSHINLFKILL